MRPGYIAFLKKKDIRDKFSKLMDIPYRKGMFLLALIEPNVVLNNSVLEVEFPLCEAFCRHYRLRFQKRGLVKYGQICKFSSQLGMKSLSPGKAFSKRLDESEIKYDKMLVEKCKAAIEKVLNVNDNEDIRCKTKRL